MICPKCSSTNVSVQAVSNVKSKGKGKTRTKIESHAVCQNCGNRWKV